MRWDDLSHSFSYQSRRWVLWGSIRAAELYPAREYIHPCPEGSAETSALLQGNRILLALCERLSLILFRAQQCGSFTAAEADSHWGWSLSPNCLEGCGSATLRAGWPYDAQMMYNSIYLVAWTSDVSLAVKRDDFPLNSSYWQVPVLVFALLWYRAHVTQPRVVWRGCAHRVTKWWLATSQQHKSECTIKAHVVSKQGTIVSFCHLAVG